jgi:hypothetical protein
MFARMPNRTVTVDRRDNDHQVRALDQRFEGTCAASRQVARMPLNRMPGSHCEISVLGFVSIKPTN